jgi:outer membrane protein OmpA-like peptidoglycan-associated protein
MSANLVTAAIATAQTDAQTQGQLSLSSSGMDAGASSSASTAASGTPPGDSYMTRYVPEPNLWELGLFGGILFPSPSHRFIEPGSGLPQQDLDATGELGVRFAYFPSSFLGLELEGAIGPTATEDGSSAGMHAARGHVVLQYPGLSIVPFLVGGMGAMGASSEAMGTDTDPAFHFGAGVKAPLDAYVSARLDLRDNLTQRVGGSDGRQTHHPEVLLGIIFTLERSLPDVDGDGFADHRDDCPSVPGEHQGCPARDTDGDGVSDDTDECPEQPGIVPTGCPDGDADGVIDKNDACPAQAASTPNGCPAQEPCNCEDTDGDGITDAFDKCMQVPGPGPTGCPVKDADGDGIDDDKDKCPNEPETSNNFEDEDGCPDTIPEKIKRFSGVVEGIEFDYNSDRIRANSMKVLDEAVSVLKEYPELRFSITGHTDNQGTRDYNVELSRKRAESVKQYLVTAGVAADRLQTRGAGPDEPRADNKTAEGQQKNRRIEFAIIKK